MEWLNNISFKKVLEHSKQAFALVDTKLKFVWVNDSFVNMLGYTQEELLQKTIFEVSDKENHGLSNEIVKSVKVGTIKDFEFVKKYVKKDLTEFYGKVSVTFIKGDSPEQSLFFVCIDVFKEYEKKCSILQSLIELKNDINKKLL